MLRNESSLPPGETRAVPPSLLPVPQDGGWQVTLVDSCCYGREGLRAALEQYSPSSGDGVTLTLPHLVIMPGEEGATKAQRCLTIRLPPVAREALHLLLQLALLPTGYYARVVVISAIEPTVVRRVLFSVGLRCQVCFADDRLAPEALCRIVTLRQENEDYPEEALPSKPRYRLTPAEYRVLTWTLLGLSVREQAYQSCTMVKTIYTQRTAALRKLKVRDIRMLLRQFSPVARRAI